MKTPLTPEILWDRMYGNPEVNSFFRKFKLTEEEVYKLSIMKLENSWYVRIFYSGYLNPTDHGLGINREINYLEELVEIESLIEKKINS